MFKILGVFLLFHRVVMEGVLMEGGRGGQGRGHSPIPPLPISEQQSNGDETNTAQSSTAFGTLMRKTKSGSDRSNERSSMPCLSAQGS